MRKVVDSNFLQCAALGFYLGMSKENVAVLTDYVAMEAYKGDTFASIHKSMEILARYPKQVVVLKGTQDVCAVVGCYSGQHDPLIDAEQTEGFAAYCMHLRAAQLGNVRFKKQLTRLGQEATAHMHLVLQDAIHIPNIVEMIARNYSNEELRIIRKGSAYTAEIGGKIFGHVLRIVRSLFGVHPRAPNLSNVSLLPTTFLFRYSLCAYLLAIRWIAVGGVKGAKPEKVRNDMVDVGIAAYATYFDGVLTADRKLLEIYQEADYWLKNILVPGVALPD